jgi:hypothetical protein
MSSYTKIQDISDEVLAHWLAEAERLRVEFPKTENPTKKQAAEGLPSTAVATRTWLQNEWDRRHPPAPLPF